MATRPQVSYIFGMLWLMVSGLWRLGVIRMSLWGHSWSLNVIKSHWGLKWKVDPKLHTFLEWLLNDTPTQLFRGGVRLYIHLSNPKSGCSSAQILGHSILTQLNSTQLRFQISDVRCQNMTNGMQWWVVYDIWGSLGGHKKVIKGH